MGTGLDVTGIKSPAEEELSATEADSVSGLGRFTDAPNSRATLEICEKEQIRALPRGGRVPVWLARGPSALPLRHLENPRQTFFRFLSHLSFLRAPTLRRA